MTRIRENTVKVLAGMLLVLALSVSGQEAGGATVVTIAWRNPATYRDQAAIPADVRKTIETRLYYSLDNVAWTRFAAVANGAEAWSGALPLADGIAGYYGVTATIPVDGIESPLSNVVFYPPAATATDRFDEVGVTLANYEDTFVAAGETASHSAEPLVRTQVLPDGSPAGRGFLKWDLSSLPAGARVASAALRLYHHAEEQSGSGDNVVTLRAAKVVGANPDLGMANWYSPDNVVAWTGGSDGGAGNLAAAEATAAVGSHPGWVVWNVTNMVQDWMDAPGENHGMALDPGIAGTTGGNRNFASREHPDPRLRPELVVTFLQPSRSPAPQGNPAAPLPAAGPSPGASSDTFTASIGPLADTYVNLGSYSDTNYSSETLIRTYTWPANNVANRGFIRWDLSAIPDNVTVTGATVWLYYVDEDGTGADNAYTVSVAKVTGVLPDLGNATWNRFDGVSPWPGGLNGGAAALAPAESSATIGKIHRWVAWDVSGMVQEWVARPESNLGMAIDADASAGADSNRYFASMEHPDPMLRPRLLVTFVGSPREIPPRIP